MRFPARTTPTHNKNPILKGLILIFSALIPGISWNAVAEESPNACAAAQRFAIDVAKRMRSGASSAQEFSSYGGVDAVSKPMLNIINYVHSHRVNKDIAPVRIGALTLAKCNNGSFGRLGYADLPEQYHPDYEKSDEEDETRGGSDFPSASPGGQQNLDALDVNPVEPHTDCGMYKQRIKEIDDQMRDGYTTEAGDSMRNERRKYRELIHKHCS